MVLPQMPDEDGLRERLIAVFETPEWTKPMPEITEKELQTDETDEARKREEEYMELAASYEELGIYLPESEAYITEEEMRREYEEYTENHPKDEKLEAPMPTLEDELDDARIETRKESRTVLSEIKSETDAKKREENLRSITGSKELEELAKELYGADYVRELLIRELCRNEERADPQAEARPVTRQEIQKAFDELEHGMIYVSIPKLRKKLAWPHDVFDEMIYSLRNDETIILHATEAWKYEPEEFFYDEDNERMGMLTWKAA